MSFINNKEMRKAIITNDMINGNRFITKMTLEHKNIVDYEVYTPSMLIGSLIDIKTRMISNKEASYILFNLIKKNDYGLKNNVLTVGAAAELLEVINDYRLQDNTDYKNILKADYEKLLSDYKSYLDSKNIIDYVYGLDYVKENNRHMHNVAILLEDLNLAPKELDAIHFIFNGNVEFFDMVKKDYKITSAYSCYGIYNEILNVLDIIENHNYPIGDCEIVYTSNIYENLVRGLLDARGINYSISSAHASSTNLISFMVDIIDYYASDFKYELLENILKNKGLDNAYLKEFYRTLAYPDVIIGFGRKRTEDYINSIDKDDHSKDNIKEFLIDLIGCFDGKTFYYNKFLEFCFKYIKSDEKKSLKAPLDLLTHIIDKVEENLFSVMVNEISSITYSEVDDNSILVSPITKRFSLRPNLFIIGLSQNYITGSDIENPFILDIDKYDEELNKEKYLHLLKNSRGRIVDALNYYLDYSSSDNIYLSYPYFNKIDLRPSAQSVFLMNLLKKHKLSTSIINKYEIMKSNLRIGDFAVEEKTVSIEENDYSNGRSKEQVDGLRHLDKGVEATVESVDIVETKKSISPSAIQTLLNCPYEYYYEKILKLPNPSYPSLNEHEWLDVNARGTFFHRVLQLYAEKEWMGNTIKDKIDNAEFEACFKKALDETNYANPIKSKTIYEIEKNEIMSICRDYIEQTIEDFKGNYRVLGCEFDLSQTKYVYSNRGVNISFNGFVDRVDGYVIGDVLHLRLVDYKTGKYKNKNESKYIQHVIYSICLKDGEKNLFDKTYSDVVIDEFIYDYVFDGKENRYSIEEIDDDKIEIFNALDDLVISYYNDEDYMAKFDEYFDRKMTELEEKDREKTICDYCTYKKLCIKRLKEGKEWTIN